MTSNSPDNTTAYHSISGEEVLDRLDGSRHGLSKAEVAKRREEYGLNSLPTVRPPSLGRLFLRQFTSPLIYVLLAAAVLSFAIGEYSDAGFIMGVLLINAIIGTFQEHSAQRAATALRELVTTHSRALRDGDSYDLDARELVPGDIIYLESGDRVPADTRLLSEHDLEIDESLLTGESNAAAKDAETLLDTDALPGDRLNMAFAGTMVERGRGLGVVVDTGLHTEIGRIAEAVLADKTGKAPLLLRMEKFTHMVAVFVGISAVIMAAVAYSRGTPFDEIFLLAVALAVSAIPEGLPVALTVALAIGMRRMSRHNVIIRRLVAVESLGSCTYIASDKTGTLTVNQLTVRTIALPVHSVLNVSGEGLDPDGTITVDGHSLDDSGQQRIQALCRAVALNNEAFIGHRDSGWTHHGDAVDVALLVMAHKTGIIREEALASCPERATIPFESEHMFSASLNNISGTNTAHVKGAIETVLPMCETMTDTQGQRPIDRLSIEQQSLEMARQGYRVLAIASGPITLSHEASFSGEHLQGLSLLGLVGMIDPLRSEARDAVRACRGAGVEVAMVTGDHPATAYAIGRELELVDNTDQIVTGHDLKQAANTEEIDEMTRRAHVFARVEPYQKLDIVKSLQRNGHFVAVSGDGANDAPALKAAQVGVAMGKSGTDVARETAELIITDDNFSSIVAGIKEGRIAYANVRKVIFLLISTGAAELVLFTLALLTGMPLPLLAVQLLWLNLVTNGIQHVALAAEPGEGNELNRPPRPPDERIFNRLMIERVIISALVMGSVAFVLFQLLLSQGYTIDEARNGTLLLMVLFENIQVFNSRSETTSAFLLSPLRNKFLLFATITAQLVHIGAMYTPWIKDVLDIQPVSPGHWLELLVLAFSVLIAMELHKLVWNRFNR